MLTSSYPPHFFDDTPTHTIPAHKWYEYSGNPSPEVIDCTPRAFDPKTLRASAIKLAQRQDVSFDPRKLVDALSHHISSRGGGKFTVTQREAEFWLRLILDPTHAGDLDTFENRITASLDAISLGQRLSPEQVRPLVSTWLSSYRDDIMIGHDTMRCVAVLLRDRFDMCTAIELMLELSPPHSLARGLKFLASYRLDTSHKTRVDRAVDAYMARYDDLHANIELELVRLSPTRERVEHVLARAFDTSPPTHTHIREEHRLKALFAVQDPDLFLQLHYTDGAPRPGYSPGLFVAHLHHFGLERLELVTPLLVEQINTWNMMQWGILFKVYAEPLTDVMLATLLREKRNEDFKRRANAWLFESGRKVVNRCIALAMDDESLRDLALDVLETYAELGYQDMITAQLDVVIEHAAPHHAALLEDIETRCARHPARSTPTAHTLPTERLPAWLVKWSTRGLQPRTPLHLDTSRFPALHLRAEPEHPLGQSAITGIMRYLQQHAVKKDHAPIRIASMLDAPSRARLCNHLLVIWNVQRQQSVHAWLATSCAAMMDDDQIEFVLREARAATRTYYSPRNWHEEMLVSSQNTKAMEALIEDQNKLLYDVSRARYSTPSIIRRLARQRDMCDIALMARHETRHDITAHGYIHLTYAGVGVRISYDEHFDPVFSSTPQLSEEDAEIVRERYLAHTEKKLLALYQQILPRVLEETAQREWSYQAWRGAMDHPLIMQLHRAILWNIVLADGSRKRARCLEDITLHDQFDVPIPGGELIGARFLVARPDRLGEKERARWGMLLAEDEQHLLFQEI